MSLNSQQVVTRHLEEQLADFSEALDNSRSQTKKLRGYMTAIAEKVCDSEYGENQLSGKNQMSALDDIELRDFIIKNVLKQRINFTKNIRDLQKLCLQEQREKDEIAKQLIDAKKERDEYKLAYENLVKAKEENDRLNIMNGNVASNTIVATGINNQNNKNQSAQVKTNDSNSSIVYYNNTPYDINEVYNNVDMQQMKILEIMGENGFSETNDIVDKCAQLQELGSHTVIRDTMKTMTTNMLLETETISTPIRKKLTLYSMTPVGAAIYKKEFGRKPVKDEKTKIKEMHATLQHGYCIKDTAKILGDLGYSNVSMNSSENSIEVANNRRYVPDIVANFDAKTKTYWEVELGHHHDGDFFEKMEKAAKVTSTVYVVVNDVQTWEKVKKQITGFKLKLKQERRTIKLTIYLGTMTQLSKKNVFFDNPDNKFILG